MKYILIHNSYFNEITINALIHIHIPSLIPLLLPGNEGGGCIKKVYPSWKNSCNTHVETNNYQ